jgi:dCTP deaminase
MSSIITAETINQLIKEEKLVIKPLLEQDQITEIGIDFRLGGNFLVSVQGRDPLISASLNNEFGKRSSKHFFQETRRQLGETFILHPNQTILATSLEYVKIPTDYLLMLCMRSSYSRLGLTMSTIAQPGYCGCLSIELTNYNNNPINLSIGARIFQGLFYQTDKETKYLDKPRKYVCNVRPEPSAVINDEDLITLNKLWIKNNQL